MNRNILSVIALTLLTLPAGAADSVKTEGGLQPKDPNSSTAPVAIEKRNAQGLESSVSTQTGNSASDLTNPAATMGGMSTATPLRGVAQPDSAVGSGNVLNTLAPAQGFNSGAASADFQTHQFKQLSANYSTVSATAKLLKVPPLMRCRDENIQFVEITLRNDSPEVALVHGDIAEAKVGGSMRTAASARYVGTVASPKLNGKGRIYTGLVAAGSWGLAAPIFYENITPDQHSKRYFGTAIGVDGSRHEIEDQRFGLRVLMPGEETVGWLAFECPTASDLTSLLIPVNYSKSQLPSGSLLVKVSSAETATGTTNSTQKTSVTSSTATTSVSPVNAASNVPASLPGRLSPGQSMVNTPATTVPAPTPALR